MNRYVFVHTDSQQNMIPLEKQVCSLDLAKRLKELEVKQESLLYWGNYLANGSCRVLPRQGGSLDWSDGWDLKDWQEIAAAFTVAELGEMLPKEVRFPYKGGRLRKLPQSIHIFHGNGWIVNYTGGKSYEHYSQNADIEADARAKIHCRTDF
jgi:hypothetical protein